MIRRLAFPVWTGRFGDLNSLLVSAVCHLLILVAMGLAVAAGHIDSREGKLAIDLSETWDAPAVDDALSQDPEQVGSGSDVDAALGPAKVLADSAAAPGDVGLLAPPGEMASGASGVGGLALAEIGKGVGDIGVDGPALADFGDGAGGSKKKTGRASTDFFGISGYGERFVYVVDCSGSMSEDGKFERAVYELLQSIEQLGEGQQYYVIFYNHRSYPMDAPSLVLATPEQFEKTREWVGHARPQGGTVPLPALLAALSMKPDEIFFLSDGLFDPATGREVSTHNRGKSRQVPIHTIAFVNRENEGLMQAIARMSGGTYRYVP